MHMYTVVMCLESVGVAPAAHPGGNLCTCKMGGASGPMHMIGRSPLAHNEDGQGHSDHIMGGQSHRDPREGLHVLGPALPPRLAG